MIAGSVVDRPIYPRFTHPSAGPLCFVRVAVRVWRGQLEGETVTQSVSLAHAR